MLNYSLKSSKNGSPKVALCVSCSSKIFSYKGVRAIYSMLCEYPFLWDCMIYSKENIA